jgi:hypothetical protein
MDQRRYRLNINPKTNTMEMKPAKSVLLRIVSEGIPNSLCATTPNKTAVATAAARDKIEMPTRTKPAW